jgi:beta-lactamase class A
MPKITKFIFLTVLLISVTAFQQEEQQSEIKIIREKIENQFSRLEGDFALAFMNLSDPGQKILINSDENFHAASTMKTPVMIEIFGQAREGRFKLTDSVTVKNEFRSIVDGSTYSMDIGEDSGDALYSKIGKKVTVYDLMYDMITVSSNLATNILIELVNARKVTERMRELGAKDIQVLRGVEDIKAYRKGLNNTTTAMDLMIIMQAIATNKAGSEKDCQAMIRILKDQKFNDMIPKYLPKNVQVAHKTGSITGVHHDSGIIFLPDGKKYVLVILSKNLKDSDKATDEMAKISKEVYDFMINAN